MRNNLIVTSTDAVVDSRFPLVTGTTSNAKHALDVAIINSTSSDRAIILDESAQGITYIGTAAVGSLQAAAVWQIKKMVEASGVTTITYADGDSSFDNIWSNRASLTYS